MVNRCVDVPLRRLHDDVGLYESAEYHFLCMNFITIRAFKIYQVTPARSHYAEGQVPSTILDVGPLVEYPFHLVPQSSFYSFQMTHIQQPKCSTYFEY